VVGVKVGVQIAGAILRPGSDATPIGEQDSEVRVIGIAVAVQIARARRSVVVG
jgi:hypothetical protein